MHIFLILQTKCLPNIADDNLLLLEKCYEEHLTYFTNSFVCTVSFLTMRG